MGKPKRIQRKRKKGWRMPSNTASISRPGKFGNPFSVSSCIEAGYAADADEAREMCVKTFAEWLEHGGQMTHYTFFPGGPKLRKRILEHIGELKGKDLACFCKEGEVCHGDILIEIANRTDED